MAHAKKLSFSKAILTGSLLAGSLIASPAPVQKTAELFAFKPLGTAGELRTELQASTTLEARGLELTCGADHKKEAGTKTKTSEKPAKKGSKEAKGTETKCGAKETKGADAKCGAKHDITKAQSKTKESKCGQGKCAAK